MSQGALNEQYLALQQQRGFQQANIQQNYQSAATSSQASTNYVQPNSFNESHNNLASSSVVPSTSLSSNAASTQFNKPPNEYKAAACSEPRPVHTYERNETSKKVDFSPSKFYSRKPTDTQQQIEQLDLKTTVALTRIETPIKNLPGHINSPKKEANSNRKKAEKSKNLLGTWQANLNSQLTLPSDFTPELISQLASEGYDVVSGASRKARSRQQSTLASSINSIVDSSDEDNKADDEYQFGSGNKSNNKTRHLSGEDKLPSRPLIKVPVVRLVRYDGQDYNDNPSYKRFNQLLDDLIESYELDLQQISKNRLKKKKDAASNDSDDESSVESEIPSEYLLARQLCADLAQEAFKLSSYSLMCLVRKENLFKLQNLLFFNIKDGLRSLHFINEVG